MSTQLTGFTFPRSNDFSINVGNASKSVEDFLFAISPTITITSINTHAISLSTYKSIINSLSAGAWESLNLNSAGIDKYLNDINNSLTNRGTAGQNLPPSINLFFNTIVHNAQDVITLVITSSPQIKVDLSKGWKPNQSIFSFLKEMIGNNPFAALFGEVGKKVNNIFSSVAGLVQNGFHMTGRDIQIGPYWSLSNSPLSNYPEFTMETILVNDCQDHYISNKEIVKKLTLDYLPTTEGIFKFKPPYLFNIDININFGLAKRIYFCKATFNVVESGKYFIDGTTGEKIPEFFKVTCHFTSLLPDMINLLSTSLDYSPNANSLGYVQTIAEPKKDTPAQQPKKKSGSQRRMDREMHGASSEPRSTQSNIHGNDPHHGRGNRGNGNSQKRKHN